MWYFISDSGTSLTVEPASSLARLSDNKSLVIINDTKIPYDSYATLVINDNLSNVFDKLNDCENIIEPKDITKKYAKYQVLNKLSIHIKN